jgi:hypothetical protein
VKHRLVTLPSRSPDHVGRLFHFYFTEKIAVNITNYDAVDLVINDQGKVCLSFDSYDKRRCSADTQSAYQLWLIEHYLLGGYDEKAPIEKPSYYV